jgi:hypothetical protein
MALMATLQDRFDTGLDKVTKWAGSGAGATWDSVGLRAQLTCTNPVTTLISGTTFDLTGSFIYAVVTPPAAGTGTRFTGLGAGTGTNFLTMRVTGSTLSCIKSVAGVLTQQNIGTYTLPTHKWWRIRESGGTAFFEVSRDGNIWNSVWSTPKGIAVTAINGYVESGFTGTEAAANAFVDYINMPIDIRPPMVRSSMNASALRTSTR